MKTRYCDQPLRIGRNNKKYLKSAHCLISVFTNIFGFSYWTASKFESADQTNDIGTFEGVGSMASNCVPVNECSFVRILITKSQNKTWLFWTILRSAARFFSTN